jgi:hypothetical protein
MLASAAAVGMTAAGRVVAAATGHFLLFYAGVFALIALTAAVGMGLLATDRIILSPGGRIITQALHRALSAASVGFLAIHVALEVLAGRSHPADSLIPFLDQRRALYLGLGTVASDLMLLIAVTGIARGKFAARQPRWAWRALHAVAYLAWPVAIVHGLLGGRTAKPYVDWSYGACVAAVAIALGLRLMASARSQDMPSSPVEPSAGWLPTGLAQAGGAPLMMPVPPAASAPRALPAGDIMSPDHPSGPFARPPAEWPAHPPAEWAASPAAGWAAGNPGWDTSDQARLPAGPPGEPPFTPFTGRVR